MPADRVADRLFILACDVFCIITAPAYVLYVLATVIRAGLLDDAYGSYR